MKFMELEEKIVKMKVIRDGKKKIIKKTDQVGYKMVNGKSVKMSAIEKLNRSKSQRKASIKRKAKTNVSNLKRKKSIKKRTF